MIWPPVETQASSNALVNFVSRSPDQEPEVAEVQEEVAGLLGHPRAGRMVGDAGQVDPTAVEFDEALHLQPPQPDGVDREEVAGQDAGRLVV
jgi:hypothetical protein